MKSSDLISQLKDWLDADESAPEALRPTLTDDYLWSLIKRAIPELPEYRGVWGKSVLENQFFPYYLPNTDTLSINPFQFRNNSNVAIDNDLYMSVMPGSGYVEMVPDHEMISTTEAKEIKEEDFSYRRNIYYRTKEGGYVSLYDYDSVEHGVTDGYFYRLVKYEGILAIKIEVVTEDVSADQGVGVDISVDEGRTWLSDFISIPLDTEIDVSNYPSSSLSVKINLASNTSTSPKVKDIRILVWSVERLDANIEYVFKLARAHHYDRLKERAIYGRNAEAAELLGYWAQNLRKEVTGYFEKGEQKLKEVGPVRIDGPGNPYAAKYLKGR